MILTKNSFQNKKIITINEKIIPTLELERRNTNLKGIKDVYVSGSILFNDNTKTISVDCEIIGTVIVESARNLKLFDFPIDLKWTDDYTFLLTKKIDSNFINDKLGFDLNAYAIDEIIMQLPINLLSKDDTILSSGSSYKVMNENEYDQYEKDQIDPRWEKLVKKG